MRRRQRRAIFRGSYATAVICVFLALRVIGIAMCADCHDKAGYSIGTPELLGSLPYLGLLVLAWMDMSKGVAIVAGIVHSGIDYSTFMGVVAPTSSTSTIAFEFWPFLSLAFVVFPAFVLSGIVWTQRRKARRNRLYWHFRHLAKSGRCERHDATADDGPARSE